MNDSVNDLLERGRLIPVSCNRDCGAGCPLAAEFRGGKPVRIRDNPLRPRGIQGCPRGYRALESALSPQRLTRPMKRIGPRGRGAFQTVSWSQALEEIAANLEKLKNTRGTEALFVPPGSGTGRSSLHNTEILPLRLFRQWGKITSTKGWYSNTASNFAVKQVFGTRKAGMDPATLEESRLIILWGFNPRDTRFGAALESSLKEARRRGVPIWVLDPRRSGSVSSLGARWIPLYPGSDGVVMAALLHEILVNRWEDRPFLDTYTHGFDALEAFIRGEKDGVPKSPRWASPHCGLSADTIRDLAREYAAAESAALLPGLSIQRVLGGEEAFRLAAALQAATGNSGRPGGSSGCCIWNGLDTPRKPALSAETGPEPHRIPVNLWARACLNLMEGEERRWNPPVPLKGYYGVGSNYLLQSSDLNLTRRALEQMDLIVIQDLFLTPTAAWADYLLPATHFLEREDLLSGSDNYLFYSHKVLDPPGEARNDFAILAGLAACLGLEKGFTGGKSEDQWLKEFVLQSAVTDPEEFRRTGIFEGGSHRRIGLADFIRDPEGNPLATPSGRIEFHAPAYEGWNLPAHPAPRILTPSADFPLRLITPHGRYRVNSQNANLGWVKKREPHGVHLHPADAASRGIRQGSEVTVRSEVGTLTTKAVLTEDVMPGVAWMLQGSWEEGERVNTLSSTESTFPSAGSRTHTIWVEVK